MVELRLVKMQQRRTGESKWIYLTLDVVMKAVGLEEV